MSKFYLFIHLFFYVRIDTESPHLGHTRVEVWVSKLISRMRR